MLDGKLGVKRAARAVLPGNSGPNGFTVPFVGLVTRAAERAIEVVVGLPRLSGGQGMEFLSMSWLWKSTAASNGELLITAHVFHLCAMSG